VVFFRKEKKKRGKFLLSQKKRSLLTSKQVQDIHSFFLWLKNLAFSFPINSWGLQMFFELQEQRNTIFAASEVLGTELQMFFGLQSTGTQFLQHRKWSARWRATNVLWASRAQEHNFCSIGSEVLGGELQKFFELQEQRNTLLVRSLTLCTLGFSYKISCLQS
jgi:hypothetical protein